MRRHVLAKGSRFGEARWSFIVALGLVGMLVVFGSRLGLDSKEGEGVAATSGGSEGAWLAIEAKQARLAESGPKAFDAPGAATEFFLEQRLEPGQTRLPLEHLQEQLDVLRTRENGLSGAAVIGPSVSPIDRWRAIGPGNIGGRTRGFAIDPSDPNVLHAAGVAGGLWKSEDGGASWRVTDDRMLNLAVCTIVIDPTDPDVIYAGTGEGYFGSDVFVRGLGIFKSTDRGESWSQLPGTVNGVPDGAFHYVNDIVISPNDSSRVYAGTRSGVWRSTDAGATWSVILANPWELSTPPFTNGCNVGCTDIAVRNDRNPDVIFAAFGSFVRDGLYRSNTGGDNWVSYTTGSNQGRMTIAMAPSDNRVIYLLMADNGTGAPAGQLVNVFQATDGQNFQPRVDLTSKMGPWLLSNLVFATRCAPGQTYSQGWYDNIIAVDPVDPDVVWVGGIDLFRSDDGAQNFGIASYWFYYQETPQPPYYVHPDQHSIVFHPSYDGETNQTMYVTNDGGIYRTDNARAATSQEDCPFPYDEPLPQIDWQDLNNGYGVTQFYHGDSARAEDVYVGGAQDNGSIRAQSRYRPNEWKRIFGGDGGYVAIDPTDSQVIYIEYQGFPTIQKSTDGGETFSPATTGITDTDGVFITPIAMDQNDPQVLWTGGSRPWRTKNGATSWSVAGPNLNGPDKISAIGIAPSDGNVVYLGFDNGYVARTTNGLAAQPSWVVRSNGLVGGWVSSLAVDPKNPNVAYCTYSNYGIPHLFKTMNGGVLWTSVDGIGFAGVPDIPVHCLAIRPDLSRQLFAGTELGVFFSDDGGATWTPVNDGLAHTVVEWLDFQDANTLVAFTHGRGTYLTQVNPRLAK